VKGIFPKTYISITRELDDDPITKELRGVLREWGSLMRQYYLVPAPARAQTWQRNSLHECLRLFLVGPQERRMKEYTTIKDRMKVLLDWHRIITSPHTPPVRAFAFDRRRLGSRTVNSRDCMFGGGGCRKRWLNSSLA
jgi:hypothetical protein